MNKIQLYRKSSKKIKKNVLIFKRLNFILSSSFDFLTGIYFEKLFIWEFSNLFRSSESLGMDLTG